MEFQSWTTYGPPTDQGEWRVPEIFRDRTLSLAQLDLLVNEHGQGCLEGRQEFMTFVAKSVAGGNEWWEEVKRQEAARRAQSEDYHNRRAREAQYAVANMLDRKRTQFEEGYEPYTGCGDENCLDENCIVYRAYISWRDGEEEEY